MASNSGPVIAIFLAIASSVDMSFGRIPAYLLIAIAVKMLSPVTIRTVIPAFLQCLTASITLSLSGSSIPTKQIMIKSLSN